MKNKTYIFLIFVMLIFSSCTNSQKINQNNNVNQTTKNSLVEKNIKSEISDEEHFFSSETDPWEGFNRRMYYFNYNFDKYALLPVVRAYKFITPVFVQDRVVNFFRNIKGISIALNSTAQFKGRKTMRTVARFTINTVFGLGGIFDVASKMGMPKPYEDFGLTLAHYGVPRGPYLVLPFFGPSYLRDSFGMGVEPPILRTLDPYRNMKLFSLDSLPVRLINVIDKRRGVKFEYYQTNSPFEYEYIRFLWDKYRTLQEETGVQFF